MTKKTGSDELEVTRITILDAFKDLLNPYYFGTTYWVYYSGRGCGKSENIAAVLILRATQMPIKILCVREFMGSLADSSKALLEQKIDHMGLSRLFYITRDRIECINGSEFIFRGLRNTNVANIKSISGIEITWVDEAETITRESWNILVPSVTRTRHPQIIASFNPRYPDDALYDTFITKKPPPSSRVVYMTQEDNPFFKGSNLEAQMLHDKEVLPKGEFAHKWLGQLKAELANCLFDAKMIERAKIAKLPNLIRVVVACDPAATSKEHSNNFGIVVCGVGEDGCYYVIENATQKCSPVEFSRKAIQLKHKYNAECILVETNQGGDFIKAAILSENALVEVREVRAVKDKVYRALPVANLLSLGQIKLLVNEGLKGLTEEMLRMTTQGYEGPRGASPDAIDALCWGIYELAGLTEKENEGTIYSPSYFTDDPSYSFLQSVEIFSYCNREDMVCITYQNTQNSSVQNKIRVLDCFTAKLAEIEANLSEYEHVQTFWLPDREEFYDLTFSNTAFYDDSPAVKTDDLVLQSLSSCRQNKILFAEMPSRNYKSASGELLKIHLNRFKIEANMECLFTRAFALLIKHAAI